MNLSRVVGLKFVDRFQPEIADTLRSFAPYTSAENFP